MIRCGRKADRQVPLGVAAEIPEKAVCAAENFIRGIRQAGEQRIISPDRNR